MSPGRLCGPIAVAKQPDDSFGIGGVSAQHSVRTEAPEIARPGHRRARQRRRRVGSLVFFKRQQLVDLAGVESGEAEIEIRFLDFLQFQSEQLFIPIGPRYRSVHHEP
jgi:hypothetical protein